MLSPDQTYEEKARWYVEKLNWPVFPLHDVWRGRCSCREGEKCERPGKHPRTRHGFKDASKDLELIELISDEVPHANIAVPTGAASGIAVVDIDGERGEKSVQALAERNFIFPETATVRTGRGRHLYYRHVSGLRNSASVLMPGIDIRGEGGQAVLPPSMHISGRVYTWDPSPLDLKPRIMPLWVLNLLEDLRKKKQASRYHDEAAAGYRGGKAPLDRVRDFAERVARLSPDSGRRNVELNRNAFIGFLIAKETGLSDREVEHHFLAAAKACGLPLNEARTTINSARRGAFSQGR